MKEIKPIISKEAKELVNSHLVAGHLCALVTATNEFITEPIAEMFGFHKLIATLVEKDSKGDYTGRSYGVASFQEGKIIRVKEWLNGLQLKLHDFEKTFFYSDSVNDIPLESVTDPIATNPDDILHKHAENVAGELLTSSVMLEKLFGIFRGSGFRLLSSTLNIQRI